MLCSQMIAKQNLILASTYSWPSLHESPRPCRNSCLFCGLRTLYTLISPEISRNPSRINRFRTLYKTTEGVTGSILILLLHFLFSQLTPLESALTKNAPVTPLESALTLYTGGRGTLLSSEARSKRRRIRYSER